MNLVVTRGGVPLGDQARGLRLFKDAAGTVERYRLIKSREGWIAYYCGRRIVDTREMMFGACDPGVLIDQIRIIRK